MRVHAAPPIHNHTDLRFETEKENAMEPVTPTPEPPAAGTDTEAMLEEKAFETVASVIMFDVVFEEIQDNE